MSTDLIHFDFHSEKLIPLKNKDVCVLLVGDGRLVFPLPHFPW